MKVCAFLAAVLLVSTGCSGAETRASTSLTHVAEEASANNSTTEASGSETIAGFFGWETDDPDAFAELQRQATIRVEEAIRLCMARAGFEYIPVIPPDPQSSIPPPSKSKEEPTWGIEALVAEFTGTGDEGWADPNQKMVEAMSEAERDEWDLALYGTGQESQLGCVVESYSNEPAMSGAGRLPDDLEAELAAMNQLVVVDARVVAAEQEWSSCMAEDGYSYFSIETFYEEVEVEFAPRLEDVVPPVTYYGDAEAGWQEVAFGDPFPGWSPSEIQHFLNESTPDEVAAHFETARQEALAEVDEEALVALQRERYELEQIHEQCLDAYVEVRDEVQREFESRFVAAHRDELEKIRDDR